MPPPSQPNSDGNGSDGSGGSAGQSELDKLVTAFTAPMPTKILTDFEGKTAQKNREMRRKNQQTHNQFSDNQMTEAEAVSALEHHELEGSAIQIEGSMIREFTIHILQSLHFI